MSTPPEFAHPDEVVEAQADRLVTFIRTEPEKEISTVARSIKAAEELPAASMKVRVHEPFRVLHEGEAYIGGDVLEVPNDDEHKIWLKARWVELVSEEKK